MKFILAGLAVVVAVVLFWFDPAQHGFYPRCLFHQTTGLLCPGCGSLRALHQLLHGHWTEALRLNALLILALPFAGWVAAKWSWRKIQRRPWVFELRPVWLWLGLGAVVVFAIGRNWPGSPLAMLPP